MTAYGASRSLRRVKAKVPSLNSQPLGLAAGPALDAPLSDSCLRASCGSTTVRESCACHSRGISYAALRTIGTGIEID
jgi:hypothetical protein